MNIDIITHRGIPKGQLAIISARPDPRGRSNVAADLLLGIKRDPLEAPGATTLRILKERPSAGGAYFYDVPYIRRVQGGGLQ